MTIRFYPSRLPGEPPPDHGRERLPDREVVRPDRQLDIAQQRPRMREQVMGQQHRLRGLQMRFPWHHGVGV